MRQPQSVFSKTHLLVISKLVRLGFSSNNAQPTLRTYKRKEPQSCVKSFTETPSLVSSKPGKYLALSMLLVAFGFSNQAFALHEAKCNGCTESQKRDVAIAAVPSVGTGPWEVYVHDLTNLNLKAYTVWKEVAVHRSFYYVTPSEVPSNLQNDFDKGASFVEFWSIQPWIIRDDGIDPYYDSAYDVVGNETAYLNLWEYAVGTTPSAEYAGGFLFGWVVTITTWINNSNVRAKFEFDDGSVIWFKLKNFDLNEGTAELEFDTAQDAAGNVIPEDASGLAGDDLNPITGEGGGSIGDYFDRMGVNFNDSNGNPFGGFSSGTCYRITCREDSPDEITCTAQETAMSNCL